MTRGVPGRTLMNVLCPRRLIVTNEDPALHEIMTDAEMEAALAAVAFDDRLTEIRRGVKRAVAEHAPATACALMLEECRLRVAAIAACLPAEAGADWKAFAGLEQLRSALSEAGARLS